MSRFFSSMGVSLLWALFGGVNGWFYCDYLHMGWWGLLPAIPISLVASFFLTFAFYRHLQARAARQRLAHFDRMFELQRQAWLAAVEAAQQNPRDDM